jgi:thymidylate synthase
MSKTGEMDIITFNQYIYNNKEENNYLNTIKDIMKNGINKNNRTNIITKSIFGRSFRYNVRNGIIPLFTTKRIFFRGIVEELIWFLSGSTNTKKLQEKNVNIWNGNSTREFLDNTGLYHLEEGDIGACFPENTIILTNNGYKNIQNITLDEKLYSHKGNWQKINNIQRSKFTGKMYKFKIKYFSKIIECTDNHPILIKENILDTEPRWCRAINMEKSYLFGLKRNDNEILPSFNDNKSLNDLNTWFILGYLLNDTLQSMSDTINFTISDFDRNFIYDKFYSIYHLLINSNNEDDRVYSININNYPILTEFKNGIPEWVQDAPKLYVKSFLHGYYLSNYSFNILNNLIVKTLSYNQSLTLQRLYMKTNLYINIYYNYYTIDKKINNIYTKPDNEYVWFPIENIETYDVVDLDIYNFEVNTDNSYTVQNIAVHNSYGHQLRHFNAKYTDCNTDYTGKGIDQIKYVIDLIKTDPTSRRILFSYWNPEQIDNMALAPCHIMYTFYVDIENNEISLKFDQRSCDTFHGLPFNIASATVLLNMICYLTNYKPGDIYHTVADMHIYSTHFYECDTIVNRESRIFPQMKINHKKRNIKNIEDFVYDDFKLVNYYPHNSIKVPMVV